MKKSLFVLVMAFIGSQSMAQIQSGSIYVTGFGSISTRSGEESVSSGGSIVTTKHDKKFDATLGLGGAYFLTDNIAVGASFSIKSSKVTPPDTSRPVEKMFGFGVGVFARYYIPMSDNFYFFGQLGYKMERETSKEIKGGTETEGAVIVTNSIGLSPGFTYFPISKIGLDLTFGNIGWSSRKSTEDLGGGATKEIKSSGLDIRFDLTTVTFGIQYFIGQ